MYAMPNDVSMTFFPLCHKNLQPAFTILQNMRGLLVVD